VTNRDTELPLCVRNKTPERAIWRVASNATTILAGRAGALVSASLASLVHERVVCPRRIVRVAFAQPVRLLGRRVVEDAGRWSQFVTHGDGLRKAMLKMIVRASAAMFTLTTV
jgi:hypothetical protein